MEGDPVGLLQSRRLVEAASKKLTHRFAYT